MAKNSNLKSVMNAWTKFQNPLRTLNTDQIEQMLDNSRHGDDVRLQLAFYQIEQQTPIYQVCINKRLAGITNRIWDIVPRDESSEAKVQAQKIKEMFLKADEKNEDGLTEAIRHLAMSVFRGRSAIKPFFDEQGNLILKKIYNWNLLSFNNRFYWNPNAEPVGFLDECDKTWMSRDVKELPKEEICYLLEERPIDIPGLTIYLRQLVGEDQWARFVEKQGIPQVIIQVPEGTPDSELPRWNNRALQIFEGGSGVLPHNSDVNVLDSARAQDPFTSFVRHQMEQISILATGGTLLTMGGSTGLGSNLAEVQDKQFQSMVNLDCKRISNAITSSIVQKCVKKLFGENAECLVRFSYVEQDDTTAEQYVSLAKSLVDMGVKIDLAEFKKITGLSFIDDGTEEWSPKEIKEEVFVPGEDEIKEEVK